MIQLLSLILVFVSSHVTKLVSSYEPTWESLDSRPLPSWYPDAKVGIFIHWGVFSVPAYGSEWFWENWQKNGSRSKEYQAFIDATENAHRFGYPDYAHRFDATLYKPDQWADIFAQAGAQYVVLTSKHHEGYTMWDSREAVPTTWNWNVMDVGPRRDVLGELATAVRKITSPHTSRPLKFGAYHSMFEWFNPAYLRDKHENFSTSEFVDTKVLPELYDLVEKYHIEVVWSDGDWEAPPEYWKSTEFLAWLATNSTVKDTVVWNDRWGTGTRCRHGSYFNCNDRFQPNSTMTHYFESCMTLDKHSWGANRKSSAKDYLTLQELLLTLVQTISRNGNLLLNVGPSADGTINPIMVDRLLGMGEWLSVNGEAVYNTRSWANCSEPEGSSIYYTRSQATDILYALVTKWTAKVTLNCVSHATTVRMLGASLQGGQPEIEDTDNGDDSNGALTIRLPTLTPDIIPCQHVWVLAMEGANTHQLPDDRYSPQSLRSNKKHADIQ